jgi:Domain of unknown function (DUF4399)
MTQPEEKTPMKLFPAAAFAMLFAMQGAAYAGETPSPAGAKVFFSSLKDGETVKSPINVKFGIDGMDIAPAGTEKPNTGHHHLLVDRAPLAEAEMSEAILQDEHNIHFGKGQTETKLELPPGKHTLQLVMGDHNHIPHNPPVVSDIINITVE